jgi:hypothetical protein
VGVPAWVWFLIAAVAAIAGTLLLLADHGRRTAHSRERRRWAALRGWQFADADPVLPDRWRHGALAGGKAGTARNLVTGSLFTAAGRRLVHVFDYEQGGRAEVVLAAVHRRLPQQVVLELWLPTVEFPTDVGLELLGPVGERYAFTSDLVRARPLITPELVALADDIGADVPVAWIEDAWVAAAVPTGTTPARLERLLRLLGDLADLVDGVHTDDPPGELPRHAAPNSSDRDATDEDDDHDHDAGHDAGHDADGRADRADGAHRAGRADRGADESAEEPADEPDGSRAS